MSFPMTFPYLRLSHVHLYPSPCALPAGHLPPAEEPCAFMGENGVCISLGSTHESKHWDRLPLPPPLDLFVPLQQSLLILRVLLLIFVCCLFCFISRLWGQRDGSAGRGRGLGS